jgi:hypothetical protein
MATYNGELQDHLGNILHPETEAKCVYIDKEKLNDKILKQALITRQQILETNTIKKILLPTTIINSIYYIDTLTNSTNITTTHGTYNSEKDRIEIDDDAFIRAISFSYIL